MTYYTVEVNGRNVRVEGHNGIGVVDIDMRFCPHTEVLQDAVNFFESLWDKTFGDSDWIAEIETPLDEWLLDDSGLELADELWEIRDNCPQTISRDEILFMDALYNSGNPNEHYVDARYANCREGIADELEKIWIGNLERKDFREGREEFQRGITEYAVEKISGQFSGQNHRIRRYILQLADTLLNEEFRAETKDFVSKRREWEKREKD